MAGLRDRLARWGYPAEVIEQVLGEFQAAGWLCDERYARSRVQSGLRRGWGPGRLKRDLQSQGLAQDLVTESLEELQVDWEGQALTLAQRALSRGRTPEQAARWLASRGFPWEAVRRALRSLDQESSP